MELTERKIKEPLAQNRLQEAQKKQKGETNESKKKLRAEENMHQNLNRIKQSTLDQSDKWFQDSLRLQESENEDQIEDYQEWKQQLVLKDLFGQTQQKKQQSEVQQIKCQKQANHNQQRQNELSVEKSNDLNQEIKIERQIKQYLIFYHNIDHRLLIILRILSFNRMININDYVKVKDVYIRYFSPLQGKVKIFALNSNSADQAIHQFSNFVDKLNVHKLDIRGLVTTRINNSKKLRERLKSQNIILFELEGNKGKDLYLGGLIKLKRLQEEERRIRKIKFLPYQIRRFKNTRSYTIFLEIVLNIPQVVQKLQKEKKIISIESIKSQEPRNGDFIHLLVSAYLKIEESLKQFQEYLINIFDQYYCITYVIQSNQRYLLKLKHDRVIFKISRQRRLNRSYVYVIAKKEDFYQYRPEIICQLEKIGKWIVGVRYLNFIQPPFWALEKNKNHYVQKFLRNQAYYMFVSDISKETKIFNWVQHINQIKDVPLESKQEIAE